LRNIDTGVFRTGRLALFSFEGGLASRRDWSGPERHAVIRWLDDDTAKWIGEPWGVLWGVMRLPRNSGNVKAKVKSDAVRTNHGESCHRYREPCIRGLRFPVSRLLGLLAAGETRESILKAYPYLETADLDEALRYAAFLAEDETVELAE
jgi:uncharacterized protein (DUF433 family)